MILFVHNNPVRVQDGVLTVDRKFHTGMLESAARIGVPLTSIHPLAGDHDAVMDPVQVPLAGLPYEVLGIRIRPDQRPVPESAAEVDRLLERSRLVVGWGYGVPETAIRKGVRYIACFEYTLRTQVEVAMSFTANPLRKLRRAASTVARYYRELAPLMRSAHEVQCNGYPMYTEAARYTPRRLLYLDSRMTEALLIPDAVLEQRLSELGSRPLRLVYSGRYENMKGALQAVQGVRAALERGADVEMDCYGAGSLAEPMRRVAATSGGRIRIHDAIAFEELVAHTRQFDLFICCHIQSDPSCTYLESMGSGLAVLGYANGMWSELAQRSGAGMVLEKNSPSSLADAIIRTAGDLRGLRDWSRNAINFARQHTFERESQLRIDSFKAALA